MDSQTTSLAIRMVAEQTYTVRRLRAKLGDIIDSLITSGPAVVTDDGTPRAVLVDINEYRHTLDKAAAYERMQGGTEV